MLGQDRQSGDARPAPTSVEVAIRSLWIVIQIGAAYLLAEQVSPFFYQQF